MKPKRKKCLWIGMVGVGLFIMLFGIGEKSNFSYCQKCGMTRHQFGFALFGWRIKPPHPIENQTSYQKLHEKFLSRACEHLWQPCGGSFSTISSCHIFRGFTPSLLIEGTNNPIINLDHVSNRQYLEAILRTIERDLTQRGLTGHDTVRDRDVFLALSSLKDASNAEQVEEWWQKYHSLFSEDQLSQPRLL